MTTIQEASELGVTTASSWHFSSTIKKHWSALRERSKRGTLRATLHGLQDRELKDIGISRAEIDYIVFYEPSRSYPTPSRSISWQRATSGSCEGSSRRIPRADYPCR